MEPERVTPPDLRAIEAELIAREPIFHRPEFGTARADFERMTDPGFWEVGASGRRYSRDFVIDTLVARHAAPQRRTTTRGKRATSAASGWPTASTC